MKRTVLSLVCLAVAVIASYGQGANNIRINEVMTNNQSSIQDEFGLHSPWVELVNTSYSTYNVRGMYITTNRAVLNKDMTVPERMLLMSQIPNGDEQTNLTARQHLVLRLNSNPANGTQYLSATVDSTKTMWIALYDANAEDIIDSVTVPVLQADASYARKSDGIDVWTIRTAEAVTPGIDNFIKTDESKIQKLKREDPHGFGITLLCMGIVFSCLALLYVFFLIFDWIADRRSKIASTHPIKPVVKTAKQFNKVKHVTSNILQEGMDFKGRDKEIYIAVISMALKQYLDDVHDIESGVLTIKPKTSAWGAHNTFNNQIK